MKELQMSKRPINGREPELSEEDIQRGKRGARGVAAKGSPAKMTPQREKSTPKDVDQGHTLTQAATAALWCWFAFQFQGSSSATL
jgi:hypothetical protein